MDKNQFKTDSKRLIKSRQEFSEWTKKESNKWLTKKKLKENKRLEELQNQEIKAISEQLALLREEYKQITAERGSAHKWADIVAKHEMQAMEALKRRDLYVFNRSKHVLKDFISEHIEKENNIKVQKQNQILHRKQLMKSHLCPQIVDNNQLIEILKDIRNVKKGKNKMDSKSSENVIQRKTETLSKSKKFVTNPKFIQSNASPIKSSNKTLDKNKTKVKTIKIKELESKQSETTTETAEQTNGQIFNAEESDDNLPIDIAIKLYQKLKVHKNIDQNMQKQTKIYRNVAISTTPSISRRSSKSDIHSISPSESVDNINESDQYSIDSSVLTTYMSVPLVPKASNRASIGLSEICKRYMSFKERNTTEDNLEPNLSQDLTIVETTQDIIDPLMARINNLKELIDRNIRTEESDKLDILSRLSLNSKEMSSSHSCLKPTKIQGNIETEDKPIEDLSAISSSSSATFKTLPVLTHSGLSSPSEGSWLQLSLDMTRDLVPFVARNASNEEYSAISSFNGQPLRNRNAFWKEVFERAGIDIDVNQIDNYIPERRPMRGLAGESFSSFTLSSLSSEPNSHSTPKHF